MTILEKLCVMSISAFILAGCSAYPHPIIDQQGVDMSAYAADLAECESYAGVINVGEGAAKGAAGGAAVGALSGAISGDAAAGAGYGAIYGASSSAVEADLEKQLVVKRCLDGRGYRVLN